MQLFLAFFIALLNLTFAFPDPGSTYTININDTNGSLITYPSQNIMQGVVNPMGSAGDVNGDGIDDMFITVPSFVYGAVYVIYGRKGGIDSNIDVTNLTSEQGFAIYSPDKYISFAESVGAAGDINGDGLDDIMTVHDKIGNTSETSTATIFVIYGRKGGLPNIYINQTNITGSIGFTISNIPSAWGHDASILMSRAGDINHDGNQDILIGAPHWQDTGAVLVVYGRKGNLPDMDWNNITSDQAALIYSKAIGLWFGMVLAPAGDVNGDGIDDFLVSCQINDKVFTTRYSYIFVIYGDRNFTGFNLADWNSTLGFFIVGDLYDSLFAHQLSARGGDINGDGINDIIIGYRRSILKDNSTTIYVLYGTKNIRDQIFLAQFTPSDGVKIVGTDINYEAGVSGVGDVNGDGVDDILIGDCYASAQAYLSGDAYVLYGSKNGLPSTVNLTMLEKDQGYRITGRGGVQEWFGFWVNPAGDVNADGINDMMIGMGYINITYVVYGTHGTPNVEKSRKIMM